MCVEGHLEFSCTLSYKKGKYEWPEKNGALNTRQQLLVLRLVDKMGLKERWHQTEPKKARRVFADSWFASVETVLALREEMGVHFTGRNALDLVRGDGSCNKRVSYRRNALDLVNHAAGRTHCVEEFGP